MELKILVINQFASAPSYNTGAGERHYFLASHLSHEGYDFTIISGGVNHLFIKNPKTEQLFNEETINGGRFFWVRMRKYNPDSFAGRAISWFEFFFKLLFFPVKRKVNPDLVLVSSMSLWPAIYASFISRRYKIPFILEIRDIWPLTPVEVGGFSKNNPLIILFRWLEKFAYSKADSIIALMPRFNMHLQTVTRKLKPVYWIPNAIEDRNVSEPVNIQIARKENDKFIVVYAGAVGFSNAMEYFVKAAEILKEYKNIELLIIGNGPAKNSLVEMSKGLPNIIFRDKIPKDAIQSLLKEVDAGFISWKNIRLYDFGVSANKYNDYMLAGIPIISASNIYDDPVTVGNCGIQVPAEDERSIADAIIKLYEMDPVERQMLGFNGYKYVTSHNTYRQIARQYHECIEDTISRFNA